MVEKARLPTFQETFDSQLKMLDEAEKLSSILPEQTTADRDFRNAISIGKNALEKLNKSRGFILEMEWSGFSA